MNLWDKIQTTFVEYVDALSKEQLANISYNSTKRIDPEGETTRAKFSAWKRTQEVKSKAYVAQVHAVDEAMKSGTPCPW
jgi:hypothetical protein